MSFTSRGLAGLFIATLVVLTFCFRTPNAAGNGPRNDIDDLKRRCDALEAGLTQTKKDLAAAEARSSVVIVSLDPATFSLEQNWGTAARVAKNYCKDHGYAGGIPSGYGPSSPQTNDVREIYCFAPSSQPR